ncbi:transferrin [Bacillus rossius redtenbacheri]|uniref:transferrin n=1 Tax=Bacillus rossius redtenbacheri TaxID=93214 RepID=UPI002FDDD277
MVARAVVLCACVLLPALALPVQRSSTYVYKICVPEERLEACNSMASLGALRFSCVSARDRLDCLYKIRARKADVSPVDPEDMYIASKLKNQDFSIIKEIRTKEEPTEEFRYEAVVVVHKNLDITGVEGLRGLKSCHTGVGRNVGYKVPISKLTKMGLLNPRSDPDLTARENELKALSSFFSQSCLVGKWSSDPAHNTRLKATYSNLCALCEDPRKCDYPDKYSGYDGALRCLAEHGGDVAFTKVYYVKKHFGLPIGGVPPATPVIDAHPEDYAYLCQDGSKRPVTGPACRWAARPWQGFITNGDIVSSAADLRNQISLANTEGAATAAEWLPQVLTIDSKTVAVDNSEPISPQAYLDKANYTDVIERESGVTQLPVRFCVTSDAELRKCRALRVSALSRDVRPTFDCELEAGLERCLQVIRDGGADIVSVSALHMPRAVAEYNLRPVLAEVYGPDRGTFSVAIVRKSSPYQSLADLRGARSCHTGYGRISGWVAPLYTLLAKDLIHRDSCPYTKGLSEFFSGGSCVPGVLAAENNPSGNNPARLCSLCAGNLDGGESPNSVCPASSQEAFFSYTGAFRCLATGRGDVAFAKHVTVQINTDGHNQAEWARHLRSEDFELLCPDGGRRPVTDYESCHLVEVPPHMVVTSSAKSETSVETIRHAVLTAANLYAKRPDLFKLFGDYMGIGDLLFLNAATNLVPVSEISAAQLHFNEILNTIKGCDSSVSY